MSPGGRAWSRLRVLLPVLLTLAVLGPLAWMWHASLPPSSSYSPLQMGRMDFGGGPGGAHGMGGMRSGRGTGHAPSGGISVRDLDTPRGRRADVVVHLVARQGTVHLPSGATLPGYTLNGTSPGPLIRARVGQLVEIHVRNADVAGGIALHWHGVDVPNAEDGVPGVTQNAIAPGHDYVYRWVAPHAGTFWYHSHQLSHDQVSGGLLGPLVILPAQGASTSSADAATDLDTLALLHLYGGQETVNGRVGDQRVIAAPGRRVRVRVIDTDNGPQAVWASAAYRLLATDGYDVDQLTPVTGRAVVLPAGGRADLEVTVPPAGSAAGAVGVQLGDARLLIGPAGSTAPTLDQPTGQLDRLHYGTPAPVGFDTARADRRFTYSIGRRLGFVDGKPGMQWSVDGETWPHMPMFVVREGDVVHVRIENHSGEVHPMHLHGHHAVVLSRNGVKVSGSPWWFDSLDVRDGETYEIAFVADNPGIWMDHCHNLKHASQGLVTHLMYEGVTTPYRLGSGSGNDPE